MPQQNGIMDKRINYLSSIKYYKEMVKIIHPGFNKSVVKVLQNPNYFVSGVLETQDIKH